jgi:hypothetical protein
VPIAELKGEAVAGWGESTLDFEHQLSYAIL